MADSGMWKGQQPMVFATKGKSAPPPVFASKGKSAPPPVFASSGIFASKSSPFGHPEDSPETASNLRTFRMLFHDEEFDAKQKLDFHGFGKHDDVVKHCREIRKLISKEIKQMERLIRKAQVPIHPDCGPTSGSFDVKTQKSVLKQEESVIGSSDSDDSEAAVEEEVSFGVEASSTTPTKRKRGRPPKVTGQSTASRDSSAVSSESEVRSKKIPLKKGKKKRGRPPKVPQVPESTIKGSSGLSSESQAQPPATTPKKRGRPPKIRRQSEEVSGNADEDDEDENIPEDGLDLSEKFIGFPDESPLRLRCKEKLEQISAECERQDDFLGFPASHPLRQNCILKLEQIKADLDSTFSFTGFKADDPLAATATSKYRQVAEELSALIYAIKKKRALSVQAKVVLNRLPVRSSSGPRSATGGPERGKRSVSSISEKPERSNPPMETKVARNSKPAELVAAGKKQVKVIHPGSALERVKEGPRIKNVRFCGGPGQRLPVSKFHPHEYPWNQEYIHPDEEKNVKCGSETSTEPQNTELSVIDTKITSKGVAEEMLLDRQRVVHVPTSCLVKAAPPCTVEQVDAFGFPVIVTDPFPPKPLCFLCGSAGIKQLLFCSVCCEPYHPFCVGDDALLASYVMFVNPPKTKKTTQPAESEPLSEEDSKRLDETFRTWTCPRCTLCKACGKNKREPVKTKEKTISTLNSFVKCSSCKEAYHTSCLGKRYDNGLVEEFEKVEVEKETVADSVQQWLCETCAKCRSCGVKLEGLLEKKYSRKKNSYMLCVECFKRRQKGSFCPVCNVCYDDDDYDTRMMECGECKRWVHAVCEGVSEEQYQILSALPESIEFICRICDKTGNPLWLQAVRMEMITGCESVLRIFRKKALSEARKRRSLNFDLVIEEVMETKKTRGDLSSTPQKILQPSELANRSEPSHYFQPKPEEVLPPVPPPRTRRISKENETACLPSTSNKAQESRRNLRKTRTRRRKPSPVNMFETSDGNIVPIHDCYVRLRDVVKFPTKESSKYFKAPKSCSPNENCLPGYSQQGSHDFEVEELKLWQEDALVSRHTSLDITPKKSRPIPNSPICITPRFLCTPSKKVGDFIEIMQKQVCEDTFFSIMHFRDAFFQTFDNYFGDATPEKRETLLGKFHASIKEAFTWFDEDLINNSDLPKHKPRLPEDKSASVMLRSSNPFEDSYWDENAKDSRKCAFCGDNGDMAPDGPGRLLWAGLTEWIHVNCALWSSEVWEEESGALQQVGQALTRSRNLSCSLCGKKGASVSCCHGSCHMSYHFTCAVRANCGMKLDKNVFCQSHSSAIAPEELQHEFQVQRKVYVDFEYIKKKDKPAPSGEIRVFIGSLKIDFLGHVVPISVCSLPNSSVADDTVLVPSQYTCTRLFWSQADPWQKCSYQFSADIQRDYHKPRTAYHCEPAEEFHIVVNHSERDDVVRTQLAKMDSFHSWIDTAPMIVDEYNEEWIPPFPHSELCRQEEPDECNNNNSYQVDFESRKCMEEMEPSVEPLSVASYMRLYQRMRDLNKLLKEDIAMLSSIERDHQEKMYPKKAGLDSFTAFEERLKASGLFAEERTRQKLFSSMLDGAVNDSSESEASFSSGSSTSSTPNSAVNSEDEESLAETTESSTSSSEEPETTRRATRTRSATGEKSPRVSAAPTDRRLRSREKKGSVKCPTCGKAFDDKNCLSKHTRSCKPAKTPRKMTAETGKQDTSGPSRPKRGRPRKSDTSSSPPKNPVSAKKPMHSISSTADNVLKKETLVLSSHQPSEENQCPNCGNKYRTAESLQKHLAECFSSSSEELSGNEGNDQPGGSRSPDTSELHEHPQTSSPPPQSHDRMEEVACDEDSLTTESETSPQVPEVEEPDDDVIIIAETRSTIEQGSVDSSQIVGPNDSSMDCSREEMEVSTIVEEASDSGDNETGVTYEDSMEPSEYMEAEASSDDITVISEPDPQLSTQESEKHEARSVSAEPMYTDFMSTDRSVVAHTFQPSSEAILQTVGGSSQEEKLENFREANSDYASADFLNALSGAVERTSTSFIPNCSTGSNPYNGTGVFNAQQNLASDIRPEGFSIPETLTIHPLMQPSVGLNAQNSENTSMALPLSALRSNIQASLHPPEAQHQMPIVSATPAPKFFPRNVSCMPVVSESRPIPQVFESLPVYPSHQMSIEEVNQAHHQMPMYVGMQNQGSLNSQVAGIHQHQQSQSGSQITITGLEPQQNTNVMEPQISGFPQQQNINVMEPQMPGFPQQQIHGSLQSQFLGYQQHQDHSDLHLQIPGFSQSSSQNGLQPHIPTLPQQQDQHVLQPHMQDIQPNQHLLQPFQKQNLFPAVSIAQNESALHSHHHHPAPYVPNVVQQQNHPASSLSLSTENHFSPNPILHQGMHSLIPQQRNHHVPSQALHQVSGLSSDLVRLNPSDGMPISIQNHVAPAMFPQQQSCHMPPAGVVSSSAHEQHRMTNSYPNAALAPPHICPHHSGQPTSGVPISSAIQSNSQLSMNPATLPPTVENDGVSYILVQQGNTLVAIPANQAFPQAIPPPQVQSDTVPTPQPSVQNPAGLPQLQAVPLGNPNFGVSGPSPEVFLPGGDITPLLAPSVPQICTAHENGAAVNCLCPKCVAQKKTIIPPPVVVNPADIHTQFIAGASAKRALQPIITQPLNTSPGKNIMLKKNALIQPKVVVPPPVSPPKVSLLVPSTPTAPPEPLTPSKVPISSPNIAVVRPMENPLQKISNQIAQIEANFNSIPTSVAPFYQSGLFHPPQNSASSRALSNTENTVPSSVNGTSSISVRQPNHHHEQLADEKTPVPTVLSVPVQKPIEDSVDLKTKSIKVTLKRKEGGDSYSINNIEESGIEATGAMRSLKIKARITSGEQAGTSTDVVVYPLIQAIPIVKGGTGPKPTIVYDENQGLVCKVPVTDDGQSSGVFGDLTRKTRLTHRAVIIYEVKCNGTVLFRSSDVRAVWGHIFEVVQGTRLKHNLPPLAYPVTNLSLPENQREAAASFNMLGLTHQAVQFLLEQLPGANSVVEKHRFRFHEPKTDDALPPVNSTGCARTEGFKSRKPFDMFGWLASKHRSAPTIVEATGDWARQDLPLAMRYRNLKEKSNNTLVVYYSAIHGRGLFTRRDIPEGEIIIEYAGELIRSILSDPREKYYESKGIGCYFFRIDDYVIIDATMKGNAARFINHSCEPNCKSKAVEILGKKHILIFAERRIRAGEELTYDYKFAVEDFDKKIPCTCGAKKCRKYLN